MAKYLNDSVMDDGLNSLKNTVIYIAVCSSQPLSYAAIGTAALGTCGATGTDFTVGNGDSSGRKVTYAGGTITVGTSGNVTHIAYATTAGDGTLIAVGTCASTAVTASGTVIVNAHDITEVADIA